MRASVPLRVRSCALEGLPPPWFAVFQVPPIRQAGRPRAGSPAQHGRYAYAVMVFWATSERLTTTNANRVHGPTHD